MSPPTAEILEVPGARIYYEVQGSGPVLSWSGTRWEPPDSGR
jgi:hypothetical protein